MIYTKIVKNNHNNKYKCTLKDIGVGSVYGVLRNEYDDFFLYTTYEGKKSILYRLNDYISSLFANALEYEHDPHRCYYENIIEYNRYFDDGFELICEKNDKYKKKFYLRKNCKKILIYDSYNDIVNWYEDNILKLEPNNEYIIYNFEKTIYGNIILAKNKKNETNYYYVNNKVMNILEKYFKSKKDIYNNYSLYCTYNNYEARPNSLTLITGDKIITNDGMKVLRQKLYLKDLVVHDLRIGYCCVGSYTFYINNYKLIDYKKEGRYNFLAMHIYNNDNQYNNMILGYEFKEKEYYYLKFEEKLILKNIDKEIAKNFEEMKKQDLYTYLLSNNEKRGMSINIDKDHNITYRLVWLNDDFFKSKSISTLDISLLKSQIVSEPCEINHFNGEVEDFDYKD